MIVVDSSAIIAVLFAEPGSERIAQQLLDSTTVMSAATFVETSIVVEAKAGAAGGQLLDELIDRAGIEIVPVDAELAVEAIVGWRRYGKGRHAAALNFGDIFSYALARRVGAPLLFVGDDFAETDIEASDTESA